MHALTLGPGCGLFFGIQDDTTSQTYAPNIACLSICCWKEGARSCWRGNSNNIAGERSRESAGKNGGFGALQGWYARTPTESAPAPGSPHVGKSRKTRAQRREQISRRWPPTGWRMSRSKPKAPWKTPHRATSRPTLARVRLLLIGCCTTGVQLNERQQVSVSRNVFPTWRFHRRQ